MEAESREHEPNSLAAFLQEEKDKKEKKELEASPHTKLMVSKLPK